jgi:hypothetical protein
MYEWEEGCSLHKGEGCTLCTKTYRKLNPVGLLHDCVAADRGDPSKHGKLVPHVAKNKKKKC